MVSSIKSVEIWPLEEVKNYLRISHEYDDKLIANLTATAIDSAELFTGLSLHIKQVNCKVTGVLDVVRLKYIPILEIGEIYLLEKGAKNNITNDFGHVHTDNAYLSFDSNYVGKVKWLYFRGQILYKDFNLKKYYYDKKKEFLFARI